jgi:hypothetical protein
VATAAWALSESGFGDGLVGGKSANLATLRGRLPDWVGVPTSVALPFGTFERVLAHDTNVSVAERFESALAELVRCPHLSMHRAGALPPSRRNARGATKRGGSIRGGKREQAALLPRRQRNMIDRRMGLVVGAHCCVQLLRFRAQCGSMLSVYHSSPLPYACVGGGGGPCRLPCPSASLST